MFDEESSRIRKQQKFLQDVEQAISAANREIIHAQIPKLDRASFVAFATRVAELRADYLKAAMGVAGRGGGDFTALRDHRERFEEAKAAFAALERSIERGYVDIDGAD
jgi:16S rRNA G527 N7-methylase RsmG